MWELIYIEQMLKALIFCKSEITANLNNLASLQIKTFINKKKLIFRSRNQNS